jgi:hypothetical protein
MVAVDVCLRSCNATLPKPLAAMAPADAADALLSRAGIGWTRRLAHELDRRLHKQLLKRFVEIWGLSNAAAAGIFQVSRHAFAKWLAQDPLPIGCLPSQTSSPPRSSSSATSSMIASLPSSAAGLRLSADVRCSTSPPQGEPRRFSKPCASMFDLRRVQP